MRPLFTQDRVAASAGNFLDGLLGDERRKTGWMRAEAAGDISPWRQQAILGRGSWDADALHDIVRDYALDTLADPDAVLVIDKTGFLTQGHASCGVARHYTGSAGKITNCQIGVFASYVSRHGHAFIDRALYLPKAWADDAERRSNAHLPEAVEFATKPSLACAMIQRALMSRVPFSWWLPTAFTVWGTSKWRCSVQERAMFLASAPIMASLPGASPLRYPVQPRKSPRPCPRTRGNASRRGQVQKAHGCTTGPIFVSVQAGWDFAVELYLSSPARPPRAAQRTPDHLVRQAQEVWLSHVACKTGP